MEQAQFQHGLNEQSTDPLKGIPEEMEGQWRAPAGGESDQNVDEGHGHGKKSMLNKMKDKAKTLKTKVKKKLTPHHEASHEEDHEESQEDSYDATTEEEEGNDVEEHQQTGDRTVKDIDDNVRGEYRNAEDNFQTGEVNTEANKSSIGLGKVQQIKEQFEDEKPPITTRFGESIPSAEIDNNSRVGYESVKDNFQNTPENTEAGKAWNQSSSEGADRGKESSAGFGVYNSANFPEKPGEEQFQSPDGMPNDNVKATPEKAELGKTWSERASEGFGFAKEKLQGYGVLTGMKSAQKPAEESQSSPGNVQDKFSAIGEGKEIGSDMRFSDSTEEIKTGPSETGPGYLKEDPMHAEDLKTGFSYDQKPVEESQRSPWNSQDKVSEIGEGKEMSSDTRSSDSTEEIKTDPSGTGPGYLKEASVLVSLFVQTSSDDKDKDTVMEGECQENENEGTQLQQSGEPKSGQNFATKIYSAKDLISSKLGYGGQTNQDPIAMGETKPDDQIQTKEMDIDRESLDHTEAIKAGPAETSSGYVKQASKLADELKNVLSFDQTSSNNKEKDTVVEGEHRENEGDGKAGQSFASKIYAAKDVVSSKLGYGGQTNQDHNVMAESKPADQVERSATESVEGAKESKETLKSTIVSKLSPGEDDKALSDVITGAVSNTAKSLKESLGGLYGGNGKVSTTDTNMAANETNNQSTVSSPSGGKGIVDRVTGVVGSIFGSKQGDNNEQYSAPEKSEPKSQVQLEEQVAEVPKY